MFLLISRLEMRTHSMEALRLSLIIGPRGEVSLGIFRQTVKAHSEKKRTLGYHRPFKEPEPE